MKHFHAGNVVPSSRRFTVTDHHPHPTLSTGDIVSLVCKNNIDFYLLRHADGTLHAIQDDSEQYVHLEEVAT